MSEFSELLKAIASLAWPLIFGVVVWKFYEPLKAVIDSIRGRRFTLKVAGNELTVEEATEQQRHILSDLQTKFADLQRRIDVAPLANQLPLQRTTENQPNKTQNVLWVDDRPKNNSYLVATLADNGVSVTTALSTNEALEMFRPEKFDRIISDMGRPESNKAGIDLVKQIRLRGHGVPIFIFCGPWAARNFRQEALNAGATEITSSGTTLLRLLEIESKDRA